MQTTANPLLALLAILGFIASVLGLATNESWRLNAVNRRGISNMTDIANDTSVNDLPVLDQKPSAPQLAPIIILSLVAVLLVITCAAFCCLVAQFRPAEREEDGEAEPQETTPLCANGGLLSGENYRSFRDTHNSGAASAFAGGFGGRFYSGGGCGGGFAGGDGF